MPPTKLRLIGWRVASLAGGLASVRYRALLPVLSLESEGVRCRVFSAGRVKMLDGLDALVIVKGFSPEDIFLAQEARARAIPVIFDLCDNIFIETYRGKGHQTPAEMFRKVIEHVSLVVVTTEPLAEVVRAAVGGGVPVCVIPDGVETKESITAGERLLAAARLREGYADFHRWSLQTKRLIRKMQMLRTVRPMAFGHRVLKAGRRYIHWKFWAKQAYRRYDDVRGWMRAGRSTPSVEANRFQTRTDAVSDSGRLQILWFGNHGAAHAQFGMLDLLTIREALEAVAVEFPVELVVVSNHPEKFAKHIRPLAIQSRYLEWSPAVMDRALASASVVVVPNSGDPFSLCKSANRTVLALSRGVPVVATLTPALAGLHECIEHGDFAAGLRRYLGDAAYAARHVALGQELIDAQFGSSAIARAWWDVFDKARSCTRHQAVSEPQLLLALHLKQDIDLAIPIVDAALQQGIPVEVWHSFSLLHEVPRLVETLCRLGVRARAWPDDLDGVSHLRLPSSVLALLTIAESNLRPHRFTRRLTELANAAGIATGTCQHGFENIGLTYDDDVQAIDRVNFAAQRIFLWGPLETLHQDVPDKTRFKCVPVGCPKPTEVPTAELEGLLPAERPVIGVFENLHWHRYDDDYRAFFISGVQKLAEAYPQLTILVKPHHAGMWLTSRFAGTAPAAPNLVIADPKSPSWEAHTAPSLLGRLVAVITTPSTVALDAARRALPTAVVGKSLDIPNYRPLPLIASDADWVRFVAEALDPQLRTRLVGYATDYARRVLVPGDAPSRILDDLLRRGAASRTKAARR